MPRETVRKLPIEYVVRKDNPVPVESTIEVSVTKVRKDVYERVIERPVEVLRVIEKAIPVEKIVEVEVERVTENAKYTEKVTQRKVPFDQVIEQKYEVLVANVVEVPVHKEILVPQKTTRALPREVINAYERDIIVDTNVTIPVEGHEFTEADIEITDEDLNRRIQLNKNQISSKLNERAQYNRLTTDLSGKITENSSAKYNSLLNNNARLNSEMMELESRLDIVQKDRERLANELRNRTVQHISYTAIPAGDVSHLKKELEGLLSQNNALISQAKNAANQVNNATVL